MFTIICITILAYMIMGKDIKRLLARVKNVDWRDKINRIYIKLQPYALKVGRVAARPLLQFYYVMKDEKTSTLDRILIYAAIIYTISPVSLIPSAVFKFIGVLDEGAALLYAYKKIKGKITPGLNSQVAETHDQCFGTRYEMVRE